MTILSLAACSTGGDDDEDVTAADAADDTDAAAPLTFEECLAEQGVTLPEGPGDGGAPRGRRDDGAGALSEEMRAAFDVCRDLAPDGVASGAGDPDAFEAFRDCLAEQGVELPGPGDDGRPSSSADDPAFAAAQEACADLRPEAPSTTGVEDTP